MARSPGFGSSCHVLTRPIQTRFRCAYTYRLKLARNMKSLTHYTKGTPSPRMGAPTACRLPISGSVSLPLSGCFSPFPHGTCSLSVVEEYLGLEGGPPMFRQDFTCPALLESLADLRLRGCHPLRPDFPIGSALCHESTGLVRVRSPLLTESRLMSFPTGTEMFQFPAFAFWSLCIQPKIPFTRPANRLPRERGCKSEGRKGGFPHSEIFGSKGARTSPKLIAACHVLHRLSTPRHPSEALMRLIVSQLNPCAGKKPPKLG